MPSDGDAPQRTITRLPGPAGRLSAPMLVQFVKFGIVGVSNTVLAFAIYTVLLKVFGVWYLGASAIGFTIYPGSVIDIDDQITSNFLACSAGVSATHAGSVRRCSGTSAWRCKSMLTSHRSL